MPYLAAMTETTPSQTGLVPIHSNFEELANRYEALLCDVWGVLHNGVEAYEGVVEALTQYRQDGGTVLLLSNASGPSVGIPPMLEEMGIPRDAYDDVLTSGDATRASVRTGQFGDTFWHLGPERNAVTFEGLPQREVGEEVADFILCTALVDAEAETPDDYVTILARLKARDLDLVCANPDIIVDHGEQRRFCGGALAAAYSELGGRSHYFGKPHPPIYDLARTKLATLAGKAIADSAILAVGDGLLTDIKGANDQGIDALFVTGGIAVERCGPSPENPTSEAVSEVCGEAGVRPTGAIARLRW